MRDCDKSDYDFGTNMEKKEKLNSVGVGECCFWEANILQRGLLSASRGSVPNFLFDGQTNVCSGQHAE